MLGGVFRSSKSSLRSLAEMDEKLAVSFQKINEEFDEHLLAINENTNEIQGTYELLCELSAKLEKLTERVDEISLFLNIGQKREGTLITLPLTQAEQEVFFLLYTMSESGPVPIDILSKKAGYTLGSTVIYLNNLVKKGIPVVKHVSGDILHLSLDDEFRRLQAKENVVGINEAISSKVITATA